MTKYRREPFPSKREDNKIPRSEDISKEAGDRSFESLRSEMKNLLDALSNGDIDIKEFRKQGLYIAADMLDKVMVRRSQHERKTLRDVQRIRLDQILKSQEAHTFQQSAHHREFIDSKEESRFIDPWQQAIYDSLQKNFGAKIIDERILSLFFPSKYKDYASYYNQKLAIDTLRNVKPPTELEGMWYLFSIHRQCENKIRSAIYRAFNLNRPFDIGNTNDFISRNSEYWHELLLRPRDKRELGVLVLEGYMDGIDEVLRKSLAAYFGGETEANRVFLILEGMSYMKSGQERFRVMVGKVYKDIFAALGAKDIQGAENILKQALFSNTEWFHNKGFKRLGLEKSALLSARSRSMDDAVLEKNVQKSSPREDLKRQERIKLKAKIMKEMRDRIKELGDFTQRTFIKGSIHFDELGRKYCKGTAHFITGIDKSKKARIVEYEDIDQEGNVVKQSFEAPHVVSRLFILDKKGATYSGAYKKDPILLSDKLIAEVFRGDAFDLGAIGDFSQVKSIDNIQDIFRTHLAKEN